MSSSCHLGCRKRAQPDSRLLVGFSDLTDPLAQIPSPHAPVNGVPARFLGLLDASNTSSSEKLAGLEVLLPSDTGEDASGTSSDPRYDPYGNGSEK
ncbi:hypothetical protein RJ639_027945 [Escallonia herrerae]|uniref:Uncharacterized protein n=1 Tax=Escallonia herrerae TaxID=1293975 RepID=A0AA89BPJ8_9ASTE|nr:hypothetical protein RJ639_027945 [Escallonia herrerae]